MCLEPDPKLVARIAAAITAGALPGCCQPLVGTLPAAAALRAFDTVLYIDVLEHIDDDRGELERASKLLRRGGHLLVLAPAHPFLFTPFDRAIGHFRRYTRRGLRTLTPAGLRLVRLAYLDSVGMLASLGNRLLLRSAEPSPRQIAFWDRVLVRISTVLDPILGYTVGKSVLAVWRKEEESR